MIRKITIGFSTSRRWNPMSALIRWWWNTPYSHVYIKWSTPWEFNEVLEASGTSVHMTEYNYWKKKNRVIRECEFTITRDQFNRIMKEIRSLTGHPYGWLQALGIAIAEIFRLRNNPLGNGSRQFVCSEIGLKLFEILEIKTDLDHDLVSPSDLWDLLNK